MSQVTIDQLKEILRKSAGEDESVNLDGDVLDTPFLDLGYDSLALLEAAALVKREFGIAIADDGLEGLDTPRRFLAKINQHLAPA